MRFKVAGGHVTVNQLSRVGDPFVNENEYGTVTFEQKPDSVARTGSSGVVRGNHVVGLAPTELPREFPPDGIHLSSVLFPGTRSRRQTCADDGNPPNCEGIEDFGPHT